MRSDRKNRPKEHQGLAAERRPEGYRLLKDGRIDGRSLRRTGRTENLSVRVVEGFTDRIKQLAFQDGVRMGELVMAAVNSYRPQGRKPRRRRDFTPT